MSEDHFTLMIASDDGSATRRMSVPRSRIFSAVLVVEIALCLLLVVGVDYVFMWSRARQAERMRVEAGNLEAELTARLESVDAIDARLAEVRRFDEKLRTMTDLKDDGRDLDLEVHPGSAGAGAVVGAETKNAMAAAQVALLASISDDLARKHAVSAQVPAGWPTSGWLTSGFGLREDPFSRSDERVMHSGADIVAPLGTEVRATAPGLCLFAGERGPFGLSVAIDHGRGYITHYAHLAEVKVEAGAEIKRGQAIGALGNTGRSTGAHLHYEVRRDGVPVDPEGYLGRR